MHVVVYGGLSKCCHETVTKQGFAEVKELLYGYILVPAESKVHC